MYIIQILKIKPRNKFFENPRIDPTYVTSGVVG